MACFGFEHLHSWATEISQLIGLASLSLSKPTLRDIERAEAHGNRLGFNHRWVEATQSAPPLPASVFPGHKAGFNFALPRWQVDHKRKQVGKGRVAYDRAVRAICAWKHMDLGWSTVHADPPVKGGLVCVLPHLVFAWMKLPLKVAYVHKGSCSMGGESGWTGQHLKYAHSTLQGHALAGEERFAIEWHKEDDSVWYDIYTVSRPATPLAAISYPVIRLLQKQFQRDSFKAVTAAAAD
ncbi:hypothetical protein WJX77_008156 [Trebouxia sp. C0004]